MSADSIFKGAIVLIATSAAIVRFAIVEYEGVRTTWRRVIRKHKVSRRDYGRIAERRNADAD